MDIYIKKNMILSYTNLKDNKYHLLLSISKPTKVLQRLKTNTANSYCIKISRHFGKCLAPCNMAFIFLEE